jgi:hypothetical protein
MLEWFELLRQGDARWAPLIAIPAVIAGGVASLWLIVSGIKGIIAASIHPKPRIAPIASPERIVKWIGTRPPLRNANPQHRAAAPRHRFPSELSGY